MEKKGKDRPPYLIGLLCLLPLIGAFVGVALILYGIFRYKDKKLILIGSGGVLFTIALYSLIFYNLEYGGIFDKEFAGIAQMELDNLVKDVELYKLQTGAYPDSLAQLVKYDKMVNLEDPAPLQKARSHAHFRFEYRKIGDKYTLFSVGRDGIPHTADDIYPSVAATDSSRIGLIKTDPDPAK